MATGPERAGTAAADPARDATARRPGVTAGHPRQKAANPFTMQQRRDANVLLGALKARRDAIRKNRLDPRTATFDDGLERYVTEDAGRPGKTLSGLRDFALPHAAIFQAQLMQDLWALYELDAKRDGFFVDFGATNGTTMSNSMILERHFGWRGILAEPNPTFHQALFRNRKCSISTKCVHSRSGDSMEFLCAARPMFSRLESATAGLEFEEGGIEERIRVETVTLNDLLDEHGAPEVVDFISIDTEGSELDILSSFDFSRRHVRLFAIEHNHEERRDAILELMTAQGEFRRFPELSWFDDWYVHRDDVAAA